MITVVMLNWARPEYTISNIHRYATYGIVNRILCFNNGSPLDRSKIAPTNKCVLIEASENMGLYARFAVASLATTDAIFHTDDDIGVPEGTLNALYAYWLRAPLSCHGLYGRPARPAYQQSHAFGPVEIVLTRALLCSRQVNNAALSATHLFDDLLGVPHGNGEDIILSFTSMALSRVFNAAYHLPAENYPVHPATEIHRRWPDHLKHRQRVVARCRKVFSL
jgi:hypothetical protein